MVHLEFYVFLNVGVLLRSNPHSKLFLRSQIASTVWNHTIETGQRFKLDENGGLKGCVMNNCDQRQGQVTNLIYINFGLLVLYKITTA